MTDWKDAYVEGKITDGKLDKLASIKLAFKRFPFTEEKSNRHILPWDKFGEILILLSFVKNETHHIIGSGVMIGPGIALTAHHIFSEYSNDLQNDAIVVLAHAISNKTLVTWLVSNISSCNNDLAVLTLQRKSPVPDNMVLEQCFLSTRTPVVGEVVMIAGFRSSNQNPVAVSDDKVIGTGSVLAGIGKVTDVWVNGRDRVMMPHPCFSVDCCSIGGMSGGPVFDQAGNVIGVLSTSIDSPDGPSTVSCAWAAFHGEVVDPWLLDIATYSTNLFTLSKKNLIAVDRLDTFFIKDSENFTFEPWHHPVK